MNSSFKLFANRRFLTKLTRTGKISPVHAYVCLNNADRSQELPLEYIKHIGTILFRLKCQAVTLIGGDPLQHPYINEIVKTFDYNTIKVGIITEGTHLHHLMNHVPVCWVEVTGKKIYAMAVKGLIDKDYLKKQMHRPICSKWFHHNVPISDFTDGAKHCWSSLLKPVIGTDGRVYPCLECCDVSMGDDLLKIYAKQKPFNGSKCEQCYNSELNKMLDAFVNKPERMEWL